MLPEDCTHRRYTALDVGRENVYQSKVDKQASKTPRNRKERRALESKRRLSK